ncbi:MAG: zf-HC2 domain-containing protein [Anaerolineae bacterium]|nr:zf-HC2 domain-containing protein [Anaerolineae bacterium]
MKCEELIEYLSDYIDNNLSEELTAAAREHLSTCHNCSVVLDSTQKMILLYREQEQKRSIPAERGRALYAQIEAAFQAKKNPVTKNEDSL